MCSIRALTVLSFVLTVCGLQNASAQVSPPSSAGDRTATHAPTPLVGSFASEPPSTDNVPISAQPDAPSPPAAVPSEAEAQGSPTASPEIAQQGAPPPPHPGLKEESNSESASVEPELNKKTEQPATCARDEEALEGIRDAVVRGDSAYATLLLDNMINGGPIGVQNAANGNTNGSATTPRP